MMELNGTTLTITRAGRQVQIERDITPATVHSKLTRIGYSAGVAGAIVSGGMSDRAVAGEWGKRVGLLT